MRYLKIVGTPPEQNFLFLGDYIDRCKKGLEVIHFLSSSSLSPKYFENEKNGQISGCNVTILLQSEIS